MSLPGQNAFHQGYAVGSLFTGGQAAHFVFGRGTQILPKARQHLSGCSVVRMVEGEGAEYFEMGTTINTELVGSPETGWDDPAGYFRLVPEYSTDMVTWQREQFTTPPANAVEAHGDGTFTYWARALRPSKSAVRTGSIFFQPHQDPRNNPLTSIVIADVVQDLPHYPYTMPGDAAQLGADLIAGGWPGAAVAAASDVDWRISIPSVHYMDYVQTSYVSWPPYLVEDALGELTNTVDRVSAQGTYVDAQGMSIEPKAFARLRILPGPRYGPVLTDHLNALREALGLTPIPV